MNPSVNFAFGLISLTLSFVAATVYIILGRLQRIAFERQRWLIEKSISLYGILLSIIKETKHLCRTIKTVQNLRSQKWEADSLARVNGIAGYVAVYVNRLLKPIVFVIVVIGTFLMILIGKLVATTIHVLFNAILLYRGYRGFISTSSSGGPSFFDRIGQFLNSIGSLLGVNVVVDGIIPPVNYIANILSFDLNSVRVSCSGSQAPINLLLDCFIAAAVVISINSDANLFWIARVKRSARQLGTLLTNPFYLFDSFCSSLSAPWYTIAPFIISIGPSPMKINQYLVSYISVSAFFANNGHSNSSPNCDAALSFPIDTIEAIMTTVLVVILIPPIVYLFAQVLFPSPMTAAKTTLSSNASIEVQGKDRSSLDKWWRLITVWASVDWFLIKSVFDLGVSLLQKLKDFILLVNSKFGQEVIMKETFQQLFEDPLQGAALPDVSWLYIFEYLEPHSDAEMQIESMKWTAQKEQFPTYYEIVQLIAEETARESSWLWVQFFRTVGCWIVPLHMSTSVGRNIWQQVVVNYVMYFLMSVGLWTNRAVSRLSLIDKFCAFEMDVLSVKDDPDAIKSMENPIFARATFDSASIFVDRAGDRRTTIVLEDDIYCGDFDRKGMFVQFLSAMTSCRSVMWQLVPGLTAFAIVSVDTSACPIFVFSEQMRSYLPPLLVVDGWNSAKDRLHEALKNDPKSWQIILFAAYIWLKESRLVQFAIAIFVNIIACYIVFSAANLGAVVSIYVAVIFFEGSIQFGYSFIVLHRDFFEIKVVQVESEHAMQTDTSILSIVRRLELMERK